ncbi:glycerol-3-phosphate 1-O-acyltransferase PlsY [Chitinibacter bivalviorum]|uniref:Glycerol-3-phosphate acyltransferase n=1 Tax=Chitinibacter bivalviorum TaxID=2739434 RepID=A0A7H9BI31_9NEIS|nr:glycerol-3-phosphate 1-O-acyltransferase PlsY [Chitinibacter bivalviorum]QLG88383.1 glycerol-3-phosphate 1-O-acyltransferase PlsY [Chitinibacter bivalviorum]
MNLTLVIFIIAAYLIGSLSFAVIVSRVMGLADPRSYGSNNPGATNVLRSGNKKAAALTLLGDALKGWVAVFIAQQLAPTFGLGATPVFEQTIAAVALAVTIGHMWPIFFSFKGGKGVATAAGILLALNGWLGLATLGIWLFVAKGLKISSLSAIAAAIAAPFLCWWLLPVPVYIAAVIAISALLIVRHKQNIIGLLSGKEGKIGEKA